MSGAGDINGDGIDDLIIGATGADPSGNNRAGESYVVFGIAEASTPVLTLPRSTAATALSSTASMLWTSLAVR